MSAIEKQKWQEVSSLTWSELLLHQWMDFRISLMDTRTEQEASGTVVDNSYTTATVSTLTNGQGVKIVQSSIIIRTDSEMIANIVVSERDYKNDMLRYLPPYERKSEVFNAILDAYDREFRNFEQSLGVVKRNNFLDSSIETLWVFERDLGIKTVPTLPYDQRREQIASRNRAAFAQTTVESIKVVANAYGNGEVEVLESTEPGVYEIKFIGKGIPNNLDGLKEALDIAMPAHLGIEYVFTFSPWKDLRNTTWGAVVTETWDELRIWDGVS